MEKKETKKAATGDVRRITLELNTTNLEDGPCVFCGNLCKPDGLDFFIEGTKTFVCPNCVKEKAPDLYLIHEYAHQWRKNDVEEQWNRGVEEGKSVAGRIILDALEESPVDRIRRVCNTQLGIENDGDIPF